MKKYKIFLNFILIAILFVPKITLSQEFCEPEYIIQLLNSKVDNERAQAVDLIEGCNKIELIDDLETAFQKEKELYIKQSDLEVIYKFNSPNTLDYTYDFINSIDVLEKDVLDDEYYSRLLATKILFDLQDYSKYKYVFDFVENRFDRPAVLAIIMLSRIIEQLPQFTENARLKLEDYSLNSGIQNMRAMAITVLTNRFGAEYVDDCISKFYNDDSFIVRNTAFQLLSELNYSKLNVILREKLMDDVDWSLRVLISDSLLKKFGEPTDLKTVIDYQPNEPNETARSLMEYSTTHFIPPKPDTLNSLTMITKLVSYTDELFEYGWIKTEETRDYYVQKLNAVNEALVNNEIEESCAIINDQLLLQTEQDLKDQLITTESYKFLHHYTIYIREEIEVEFGTCN